MGVDAAGATGDFSSISLERSIRFMTLAAILQAFGRDAGGQAQLRRRSHPSWVLLDEEWIVRLPQKARVLPRRDRAVRR